MRGARSSGRITPVAIDHTFKKEGTLGRTSSALEPHTDASFEEDPFNLVLLYCVRSDGEGGDSLIITADDIVENLTAEAHQALKSPVYPFGKYVVPVIGEADGAQTIRYYRTQLDLQMSRRKDDGFELSQESRDALTTLDTTMRDLSIQFRFHFEPRDLLFVHNKRAVHGRTSFSEDSSRLLLRGRVYCRDFD